MEEIQKQLGNLVDELKQVEGEMVRQQIDPSSAINYKLRFFEDKDEFLVFSFLLCVETGASSSKSCKSSFSLVKYQ